MYDLTCADPAIMYDAGRKKRNSFPAKGRPEFFNIWKKEKHRKYIYVVKKERLDDALLQCLEFRLIICINNWKNILGAGAEKPVQSGKSLYYLLFPGLFYAGAEQETVAMPEMVCYNSARKNR